MEKLIKLMTEAEEKHGLKIRFMIGLSDKGNAVLFKHTADADDEGGGPVFGGGTLRLAEDQEVYDIDKMYGAIEEHIKMYLDEECYSDESIGKYGFSDETFFEKNNEHK